MSLRPRVGVAALCAAAVIATAAAQTLKSGFDAAGFDRSVAPQDDLYTHVNGGWLTRTQMPGDRVTHGAFTELTDKTDNDLRAIIEEIVARPSRPRGSPAQQIADLYISVTDEARIEALGTTAVQPELARIDAIASVTDLAAQAGRLSSIGVGGPFAGSVGADPVTGRTVARIAQGGTLLPDRDYYVSEEPALAEIRKQYEAYLRRIFELAGRAAPADDARHVLALETALVRAYTPDAPARFTLQQLASEMPGFDWSAWAKPQGLDRSAGIILSQPAFFKAFAALVKDVPLGTWRAWIASRYLTAAAPFLSRGFDLARFDFFGTILTGQTQPRTRWKRGVSMVNAYLGDALGKLYVERHFPPAAKPRVQRLLAGVIEAYRSALRESDWMSPQARREALDKLSALSTGVAYPERWRNYSGLVIKPDDLAGNWLRGLAFDNQYRLGNVAGVAGGEWVMPPQTINAYYSPATNEMVLPAAILQPPLFDVQADDAVNYGALGSMIGHEIMHAFDDRGRHFDGNGNVRDWWTAADEERFNLRAARLVQQLNAYEPLPGLHVNGPLVLTESLADLGGLTIAFRAYENSMNGRKPAVIDGLTGEQRFFMGWARMWRSKDRGEYVRSTLQTSAYLPPALRANAAAGNVDGFYAAFGVKPGNRLYRAPAERARIW